MLTIDLTKYQDYSIKELGDESYVNLGKTDDNCDKILIVPTAWISKDSISFPSKSTIVSLRHEFFYRGAIHLKSELSLPAQELHRYL